MSLRKRAVIFLAIFACTVAFDQGSKVWARTLPLHHPQPVIAGYWDWELASNPGAAFSTFEHGIAGQVALSVIAAVALIAIGVMAARSAPEQRLKRAALAVIAGGALGNLIDRVRYGAVTDFVHWHVHDHEWPIFNVADVALLVGVGLLVIENVRSRARPAVNSRA